MATATFIDVREAPDIDRHPKALTTGVVVSFALHLGIAAMLIYGAWSEPERPPPEFVVEVVQLPKPPPRKPPQPPPAPAVAPQPPAPPTPQALPPPPPPQLSEAPIAEKAAPPPHESDSHAPPRGRPASPNLQHRTVASAAPALPANSTKTESMPVTIGRHEPTEDNLPSGRSDKPAAQTVPDFILMQIAQHWLIDYHNPRYRDIVLRGTKIVLLPNGMLGPPFGKNDPWNPREMIANYDALLTPQAAPIRQAIETFLQAMRLAQPFRLPPDGKLSIEPRVFEIYFQLGDIPSAEAARAGR
jgi:hypothetical protein